MSEQGPNGAAEEGEPEFRYDSLINTLSGLGNASKDRTMNTDVAEISELGEAELEVLYRRNHYAARVVDLPADEATRRGFEVKVQDPDEDGPKSKTAEEKESNEGGGDAFEDEFRRLQAVQKFNQADKWSRLYGGGAVIIGLDDGKDMSEPIDTEALKAGRNVGRSLDFLHVVDRYSLSPHQVEGDPLARGFGLPATYTLNFRDVSALQTAEEATEAGLGFGQVIHASRMVRFWGVPLPPNLRSDQDWWGDSILQRVYESLSNLGMLERAIGNIGQTFTQAIFKMQGLRNLVKQKDGDKELMDRFIAMNLSQSVLSMMVIDAEMEDYDKRTTSVDGLEKLYDRIAQSFASAAGMPMTLAFGLSPGGMSTDDEGGARNWENLVRARQELVYIPGLEYIAHILAATDQGPTTKGDIMVEAVPLREPTEEEQATTAKTWGEFVAILIDRGVVRPSEVRNSFFGGAGFSSDIELEEAPPEGEMPPAPAAPQAGAPQPAPPESQNATRKGQTPVKQDAAQLAPSFSRSWVSYRDADKPQETCVTCSRYDMAARRCSLVRDATNPVGVCVMWGGKLERSDSPDLTLELDSVAKRRRWDRAQRSAYKLLFERVLQRYVADGMGEDEAQGKARKVAIDVLSRDDVEIE